MNRASAAMPEQLKAVRDRLENWRKHRDGGRSRVPEEFWNAAVEVARVEGVYATSKALRFNYYSLKERLALAGRAAPGSRRAVNPATFIEVQLASSPSPAHREAASGGQTVVELVGAGGARMRIDVAGPSNVDLVGLAQAFWSRTP